MARKARKIQDGSNDDDAPEVVSHSTSKANAKRHQKALYDFEAEEKTRRKARNRERDQKLKERARVTKSGRAEVESKGVGIVDLKLEGEDEQGSDDDDDVEVRMLRAMRDAENEVESGEDEDEDEEDEDDSDGGSNGLGQDINMGGEMVSGSDAFFEEDEVDHDAVMPLGETDSIDSEAPTDDEEMDEDEEDEDTPFQSNSQISSRKASYLADDLFAAAFASQGSKPSSKKNKESIRSQPTKKRRRKAVTRAKDLVIGGRTIRTLPRPSDPRSQATARSVPSARARKFLDQNLAMKGNKQAILKAKKKGWERRPANVGVMKIQGAPHGFVRSTRCRIYTLPVG